MRSEAALASDGCGREWWVVVVDQEEEAQDLTVPLL